MAQRIAVVTGASRGIGKGVAIALGEQGCIVYVSGRTREKQCLATGQPVPGVVAQALKAARGR